MSINTQHQCLASTLLIVFFIILLFFVPHTYYYMFSDKRQPIFMNISLQLGQTRYCYTVKICESIILTSPKIVDIHHIFCHILQHTILSFFYLLIELYIQLGVEKFNGIDKHKCIVQQLGLNRPDQLESIFQLIVFFFSQPVRMRSGLLCITFCMSVCMRRNKNHISGTAFHQVPKFGQSMDMDDLAVNLGG